MDIFRKLYVKFARSKWNLISIIFLYIIMFIIPLYYTINHNLKPDTQLYRTTGVFHKKNIPRRGSVIVLSTKSGDLVFSSPSPFGFYNQLLVSNDKIAFAEGKMSTILWYKRSIYLGKKVNYIVDLEVDSKTIISKMMTYESFKDDIRDGLLMTLIAVFVFFIIYLHNIKLSKKIIKQP
jgi:hypothetical protein